MTVDWQTMLAAGAAIACGAYLVRQTLREVRGTTDYGCGKCQQCPGTPTAGCTSGGPCGPVQPGATPGPGGPTRANHLPGN